jgi:hypothetical protein
LVGIEIPASVTTLEEASFAGCTDLEYCLISEDSSLVTIGSTGFAKCVSLRSFSIPRRVGEIGSNCFNECIYLYRLKFKSSESLQRIIGDRSLEDALHEFRVAPGSSFFRIEVEDRGMELEFPGDLQLALVRDIQ